MLDLIAVLAILQAGSAPARCVPAPTTNAIASPASLKWYTDGARVTVKGRNYTKYGLPRVLGANEVELYGAYQGGYFFIERGTTDGEVLYMLTNLRGCEFQPYQVE